MSLPFFIKEKGKIISMLSFLRNDQGELITVELFLTIVIYITQRKYPNKKLIEIIDYIKRFYNINIQGLTEKRYMKNITERNIESLYETFNRWVFQEKKTPEHIKYNNIVSVSNNFKRKMFPIAPRDHSVNFSRLIVTEESLFSSSRNTASKLLVQLISKSFVVEKSKRLTVTDATANIGSDTIALALEFMKVNAIEKDSVNFTALKNNCKVYGLNNVDFFHGDSIDVLHGLTQDVIYVDAPWGGRDYKRYKKLKLYLNDLELSDIFLKFYDKCKLFVFKLPINYDLNYFLKITELNKNQYKMIPFYALTRNERKTIPSKLKIEKKKGNLKYEQFLKKHGKTLFIPKKNTTKLSVKKSPNEKHMFDFLLIKV
ncbi:putative RNA methylase [Heterosigma akashiwo virus 01]|uniref:Putative RNA methylase n=1 Tax=Heterosigma akashiwo virus 01 TaxID=97195 RepID=A0A1C9C529_HAV01|nr:putative RNA methylase [Heterosigma akashiwo virus 01]AOM63392.1 putative RNA methylase [Heterosigma akashiwo virus 01]